MLYQCLTGQLPYRRDDDAALLWAHLVEAPPRVTLDPRRAPRGRRRRRGSRHGKGSGGSVPVLRGVGARPRVCPRRRRGARRPAGGAAHRRGQGRAGQGQGRDHREGGAGTPEGGAGTTAEGGAGTTTTEGRAAVTFLAAATPAAVSYSLAVDLGTSFVAAAVADDRGLEMVSLGDGALVAPAVVYVRADGGLLTGEAAARRAVSHPDRVAREIKRNLGNPTPVMLGGSPFSVSALLGALLEDVLTRVTERQGAAPEVVALTHPATWGPFRRELFEAVARSIGLPDPLYTTEPEAAAAHYASTRPLDEGQILAVYDLGGGTFDATVLRRTAEGFQILGTPEGVERLGGADFDEAIVAHVNYLAGGALGELDLSDAQTVVALARLRQDCTLAKEALSADAEATIPVFLPNRHFEVTLTRAELESMIRAPIESTIGTLDRVLRAAQVDRRALAAVLLVGGSSKIPLVAEMVSEAFGRPTIVGAHPKHAVALGAALLAEARRTDAPTAFADADGRRAMTATSLAGGWTTWSPAGVSASSTREAPAGSPGRTPAGAAAASGAAAAVLAPAGPGAGETSPAAPPAEPAGAIPEPRSGPFLTGPPPDGGDSTPPAVPADGPPPATPVVGEPAGAAPPPAGRRRSRWVPLVAGLLVLVLAGVGVLLYVNLRPTPRSSPASAPHSAPSSASSPTPAAPPATAVPIPSLGQAIGVGPTPNFVVVSPNGRQLYVANRNAGAVTVVDTAANQVTATIPIKVGPPQFIAFSPNGRTAYVSVWDDARTIAAVSVLDTTTNGIIATIPMRTRPFLAAVSPDGDPCLRAEPRHRHGRGGRCRHQQGRLGVPRAGEPALDRVHQGRLGGLRRRPRVQRRVGGPDLRSEGDRADPGTNQSAQPGGAPDPAAGRRRQLRRRIGVGDRHGHEQGPRHGRGRQATPARRLVGRRPVRLHHQRRLQHDLRDRPVHLHGDRDRPHRALPHVHGRPAGRQARLRERSRRRHPDGAQPGRLRLCAAAVPLPGSVAAHLGQDPAQDMVAVPLLAPRPTARGCHSIT